MCIQLLSSLEPCENQSYYAAATRCMMQCAVESYPVGDAAFSLIISHHFSSKWCLGKAQTHQGRRRSTSIPEKSRATEPIQSEDDVAVAVVDTSHMDLAWRNSVTA